MWLFALIVLPHLDLAVLSLRERVGAARIRAEPRRSTGPSSTEPLYWHVFVRTAVDVDRSPPR